MTIAIEQRITLRVLPHKQQRYHTAGDWLFTVKKDGTGRLRVTASELPNQQHERLLLLHELVEALLCKWSGVPQEAVDEWDMTYPGSEPGDMPTAPYHRQHVIASVVERLAAELLGVDWNDYEAALERLPSNAPAS